ncbi:MAG TPA: hypothetical protein PKY30_19885, partial [Myxococcota bacterium]|nr:hypothetical protein [Myxococcota bacterium]
MSVSIIISCLWGLWGRTPRTLPEIAWTCNDPSRVPCSLSGWRCIAYSQVIRDAYGLRAGMRLAVTSDI